LSDPYPVERLGREAPERYAGEGPFALWHVSEDPGLGRLLPQPTVGDPEGPKRVWTVDTRHQPLFWFPRACPRGCIWPVSTTTAEDRDRFFGQSGAPRLHVMEAAWVERMLGCRLFAYRLPTTAFEPHSVGGYWVSTEAVEAEERIELDHLVERHAAAAIELRITPSIWPFWDRVIGSSVEFSGIRLANASAKTP
jgi:hypothetical protein